MDIGAGVVTPPHSAGPLRLLPFRGITLAPRRIGDVSSIRAFTRPYRSVTERLDRWERRGQVSHDPDPAVYLHEYTAGGITVRGLVGGLDVSRRAASRSDVAVFPHEGIHPEQVEELATRMSEMQVNPAPILLVHRGTDATRRLVAQAQEQPVHLEFDDKVRQHHRLWALRDPALLSQLDSALGPTRALIADGHHRYAAYLRMHQLQPGTAASAGLAMLVDQDDTPLFLGAIHRLLAGTSLTDVREAAERLGVPFEVSERRRAVSTLGPDALVVTDSSTWATLRPRLSSDRATVEWLHDDLIPALRRPPASTTYLHAVDEALDAVGRRRGVAMLMPAPEFGQVLRIAAAERLLPEKATSFQPKPSVGVLIRSLRDG